jgi:hypothetical protein
MRPGERVENRHCGVSLPVAVEGAFAPSPQSPVWPDSVTFRRVGSGNFTPSLSQIRAWPLPVTRLVPPLKDWRLSPRSAGSCCFQLTRIDNGPGDPPPSLHGDYLRLITAPGRPDRPTRGPHARTSSREVLPHTARRRRAIKHFCCKSAYIKLNLPEQLRTTRCGTATPDSVRNLLLPRCRPPFFVPPDCRFAFGRVGVKDHARPAGSKKHRCFAVQSNTSRRGSPVRRYRCFSLLSSAPPAAPNVVHEDAARWKKMP